MAGRTRTILARAWRATLASSGILLAFLLGAPLTGCVVDAQQPEEDEAALGVTQDELEPSIDIRPGAGTSEDTGGEGQGPEPTPWYGPPGSTDSAIQPNHDFGPPRTTTQPGKDES